MRIEAGPPIPWHELTAEERTRATRLGDGVLYVGMNSEARQSAREAAALARRGPGARVAIEHAEWDPSLGPDRVRLEHGAIVDLADAEGAATFARSLEITPSQVEAVTALLVQANAGARDELAALARAFAVAERGGDLPSRLVLSGHSTGSSLFDGAGQLGVLSLRDVFALADALPRAAAQIEDVMLSACASGFDDPADAYDPYAVRLDAWRDHFPNLKTAWGYGGVREFHSPTGALAVTHIEAWELATRGRADAIHARAALLRVTGGDPPGYDHAVSVWSLREGYVRGK